MRQDMSWRDKQKAIRDTFSMIEFSQGWVDRSKGTE